MSNLQFDGDEEEQEMDLQNDEIDNLVIFDALDEDGLEAAILKRRLANAMIAGNAQFKGKLYNMIVDEIRQYDETLPEKYAIIMTATDINFWQMPPNALAGNQGGGAIGSSEMELDYDGGDMAEGDGDDTVTLKAYAEIFPILTHELTKSIMEFVSYSGLPEDDAVRRHVMGEVDKPENEPEDLMSGPELWKNFSSMVPINDQDLLMNVYQKFLQLTVKEIKTVLSQSGEGMRIIKGLIADSKQEMDDYNNPPTDL